MEIAFTILYGWSEASPSEIFDVKKPGGHS